MGNTTTIHDFDLNLICDYFARLERQGPGSPAVTRQALSFIHGLSDDSRIADLGCGTGGQTMTLAQQAPGHVTGIDLFPRFIDLFNQHARAHQLEDRVHGLVGSMEALPFAAAELDLIWSEGAIYNIGFERGLREWRAHLKPGGYLAVTEASWFTSERPAEIQDFWLAAYPEIDTIPNKVKQVQDAGYLPVATFVLPDTCWTDHYYTPQPAVQNAFLKEHADNPAAVDFIDSQRYEARLYDQYKTHYGYVFYIARKLD